MAIVETLFSLVFFYRKKKERLKGILTGRSIACKSQKITGTLVRSVLIKTTSDTQKKRQKKRERERESEFSRKKKKSLHTFSFYVRRVPCKSPKA
jgi:hypothetical protein